MFGRVKNGEMALNAQGNIVLECWNNLPNHYPQVELDGVIVMPNHVHGIVFIANRVVVDTVDAVGGGLKPPPTTLRHGLPEIIRAFKTFSSRKINEMNPEGIRFKWQRNYHDHIIRTNEALEKIREYIVNNPAEWERDSENIHDEACSI